MIDVQDELVNTPVGKYGATRPFDVLWRAVKDIVEQYDVVIVDCPPNLGKITQNGLRISQGFIIPTIPDILSTYGIPQIVRRVREFAEEIGEPIEPLGIIITKYQENSNVHGNMAKQLRQNLMPILGIGRRYSKRVSHKRTRSQAPGNMQTMRH